MMCSRCKKRPAVVFISQMNMKDPTAKKNEGLCLVCAKELGISQVDEYMKQMGITEEEVQAMSDQLMDITDGNDFEMGGSGTMPNFLSSLFGGAIKNADKAANSGSRSDDDRKKERKKKELKFLNNFCTNLTERAREGKLDNIIGRDRECERVIQILSRRQKNNPCLIGEPGVGKTAIAEGIAQRIVAGNVPYHLIDKEIYLLDLTALVAGTQFRGQFESRCKGLVEEVKKEGNIILFIDEVHTLVGTGDNEGTMNAANILKPSLSRGEIQVIGATTFKEYRKYIEKDAALERRFQPVTVTEPTIDDTAEVLKGIKHYYEQHHRVHIDDYTLRMCAVLSERYINDRFLPDKAIDLLDEACALKSINTKEIAEYDEKTKGLKVLNDELSDMESSSEPDYEKIAEKKGEIMKTEGELASLEKTLETVNVTEDDLSKVIELWTGIPASKIATTEYSKIRGLKEELSKRVIGQEEAIDKVSKAIRRTRVQ
ncbi:MAG: ATP-dependent Clp protease ATP-binding subunit, partial [Ruminococcus sp.]|nr:ATP-dependent Clp protease ATP-binding subunit [Ruminococcus sp.]